MKLNTKLDHRSQRGEDVELGVGEALKFGALEHSRMNACL